MEEKLKVGGIKLLEVVREITRPIWMKTIVDTCESPVGICYALIIHWNNAGWGPQILPCPRSVPVWSNLKQDSFYNYSGHSHWGARMDSWQKRKASSVRKNEPKENLFLIFCWGRQFNTLPLWDTLVLVLPFKGRKFFRSKVNVTYFHDWDNLLPFFYWHWHQYFFIPASYSLKT